MSESYEDLARRLLNAAPEASPPNQGRVTIDWQVRVLNGKPDLYLTLSCYPAMDQADVVALLRHEADAQDFDPAELAASISARRQASVNGNERDGSARGGWFGYPPPQRERRPWHAAGWAPSELDPSVEWIKFMPDYGADLPLWNLSWAKPPFDHDLLDDLADLQDAFDNEFDAYDGWASDEARERWAARAAQLVERVREALPSRVRLEVDLWPVGPDLIR